MRCGRGSLQSRCNRAPAAVHTDGTSVVRSSSACASHRGNGEIQVWGRRSSSPADRSSRRPRNQWSVRMRRIDSVALAGGPGLHLSNSRPARRHRTQRRARGIRDGAMRPLDVQFPNLSVMFRIEGENPTETSIRRSSPAPGHRPDLLAGEFGTARTRMTRRRNIKGPSALPARTARNLERDLTCDLRLRTAARREALVVRRPGKPLASRIVARHADRRASASPSRGRSPPCNIELAAALEPPDSSSRTPARPRGARAIRTVSDLRSRRVDDTALCPTRWAPQILPSISPPTTNSRAGPARQGAPASKVSVPSPWTSPLSDGDENVAGASIFLRKSPSRGSLSADHCGRGRSCVPAKSARPQALDDSRRRGFPQAVSGGQSFAHVLPMAMSFSGGGRLD